MNIREFLMKTEEMNEKMLKYQGGALPKLLTSHFLNAQECQT